MVAADKPAHPQPYPLLGEIRLLGDPLLRRVAKPVAPEDPAFEEQSRKLQAVLEAFRSQRGFGRAIAAPQIGVEKRIVAMNLGQGPFVIVNPEIVDSAPRTMNLWDDCMSLPSLMVKVARAPRIRVAYTDEQGARREWRVSEPAVAELLQHELDHLDGVLAIDRAFDEHSIIMREVYLAEQDYFDRQVDYAIQSTVREQA